MHCLIFLFNKSPKLAWLTLWKCNTILVWFQTIQWKKVTFKRRQVHNSLHHHNCRLLYLSHDYRNHCQPMQHYHNLEVGKKQVGNQSSRLYCICTLASLFLWTPLLALTSLLAKFAVKIYTYRFCFRLCLILNQAWMVWFL